MGVDVGLRQGCPLSPFNIIYVIGMVNELERSDSGVTTGGKWCRGLSYADDITFLAELSAELQLILSSVGKICY